MREWAFWWMWDWNIFLSRATGTLSGGEAQRIRLATQIGSGLVGVCYILDEPSIGLHQKDNDKLLNTLKNLRDLGNTLIVVEHDEDTMLEADYVVDIGPGGRLPRRRSGGGGHCGGNYGGGELRYRTVSEREKQVPVPEERREASGYLTVKGLLRIT